jgi:hypothetical protein
MHTFAHKQKPIQQARSAGSLRLGRTLSGQSRGVSSLLYLQRTLGNQAVQQLLQANAEEFEADSTTTASTRFTPEASRTLLDARAHAEIPRQPTILCLRRRMP